MSDEKITRWLTAMADKIHEAAAAGVPGPHIEIFITAETLEMFRAVGISPGSRLVHAAHAAGYQKLTVTTHFPQRL